MDSRDTIRVLLIEDNPGDARLVQESLAEVSRADFDLRHVDRLSAGIEALDHRGADIILADLTLPDSHGLETLRRLFAHSPHTPIVVLTGLEDESLAIEAIGAGAQDYLVKRGLDGHLLSRSISHAIERQRLLSELERARTREQQERELRSLEQLSSPRSVVTARTFGEGPLSENVPSTFAQLAERYGELLDRALEERAFRIDQQVSPELRSLGVRMGFLGAGPRDVVETHSFALRAKTGGTTSAKALVYVEEGRLMVLELMGHLVDYYRNR